MLEDSLGKDYTMIAIDFPFHGATEWKEGLTFESKDLLNILSAITKDESPFSLLGYSMGGRVALHLLPLIPQYIERVVLIAPDGLHENFWYWLATQTKSGNKLFLTTMKNPRYFFAMIRLFKQLHLINPGIIKIAHYYLNASLERIQLYERWTTMRKFKVDLHLVKDNIYAYNIPTRLMFGYYDRIILSERAYYFQDGMEEQVKIYELEEGHQLLRQKNAETIAALFYE